MITLFGNLVKNASRKLTVLKKRKAKIPGQKTIFMSHIYN